MHTHHSCHVVVESKRAHTTHRSQVTNRSDSSTWGTTNKQDPLRSASYGAAPPIAGQIFAAVSWLIATLVFVR